LSYLSFCYSLFGWLGERYRDDERLGTELNHAHMEMTPDAYIAFAVTTTVIVTVIALVAGLIAAEVFIPFYENAQNKGLSPEDQTHISSSQRMEYGLMLWLGITFAEIVYFKEIKFGSFTLKHNLPGMKAKQRGKRVDLYLPHAASFVAAMAAANATLEQIFLALSIQKAKKTGASYYISKIFGFPTERDVFPIISEEAAAVYRDAVVLGIDTLTAVQNAVERASSPKLAEFLQGISSTLSSGGNLKLYFLNSAERFMEDIKQDQRQALEQLATQAEMFVTVAVALPIFLIIILVITVWISSGNQGGSSLSTLYLVIFALVPLLHFVFATMTYVTIKKFSI